jgi:SH3-like domain-containing protein
MKHSAFYRAAALLCALALLLGMQVLPAPAHAGYNDMTVATDGTGVTVYAASSGSGKAGILYNGYYSDLSLEPEHGRYSCMLTLDYTVWVNTDKAENRRPAREENEDHDAWEARRPCNIFLGEISKDDTPVYTSPKHRRFFVRHAKGTVVAVCGEFGSDYYVKGASYGFVSKDAVSKISDMTYPQAQSATYIWENPEKRTLYASEAEPVWTTASASGYSEENYSYGGHTSNVEVTVLRDLGDWVQLTHGEFVEKRFLDPEGDHSYPAAWVKTDGILDRLRIRDDARTDASVKVKLCSGMQVRVISRGEKWAVILIAGANGGQRFSGCVQAQYLSNSPDSVKNGTVQVRLTKDLRGNKEMTSFRENGKEGVLPAGTLLTVIGVYESGSSNADQADRYLCRTEDGRYIDVESAGVLEPLNDSGITAAVRSKARLRKAPSPGADVIRQLKAKTKVEVLLRGEIWTMVKYRNETGYIQSRYLSFP